MAAYSDTSAAQVESGGGDDENLTTASEALDTRRQQPADETLQQINAEQKYSGEVKEGELKKATDTIEKEEEFETRPLGEHVAMKV